MQTYNYMIKLREEEKTIFNQLWVKDAVGLPRIPI